MSLLLALLFLWLFFLRVGIEDNDWSYFIAFTFVFGILMLIGALL